MKMKMKMNSWCAEGAVRDTQVLLSNKNIYLKNYIILLSYKNLLSVYSCNFYLRIKSKIVIFMFNSLT